MIEITRRKALGFLGAVAVPSSAMVATAPAIAAETLQDRVSRLTTELHASIAELTGDAWRIDSQIDVGYVGVFKRLRPRSEPRPVKSARELAQERFDYHVAELRKAAEDLDPRIGSWNVCKGEDDDRCALVITAHRITGRYCGDGTYEGGDRPASGRTMKFQVRLLDYRDDGHRVFEVRTSMDRMVLAEPRLNTFIGKKLGALS